MAAFDFPNSPSVNDQYTANGVTFKWNGTIWQRISASSGAQGTTGSAGPTGAQGAPAGLTISTSAPGSPSAGDMWWDSDAGLFLTYYNDGNSSQWVELNQGPKGAQGATGSTGAQGATGPTGAQGAAGAQGATGAAGSNASISSNADNRVITGGSGTNLVGESSLTYGSGLDVGGSGGVTISYSGGNLTMNSAGRIFVGNGGNGSSPMFANVSDTNTGIFFPAADTFAVTTGGTEKVRIDSSGRVSINDNSRPASDASEGAQLRVTGAPLTRNQYYSPAGHYYGSFGYTDNTNTKSWIAVDSSYAKSSAISAGIFLSAFHQDAGGSSCGFTIKNLKDGNPLVISSVTTAASVSNPAVESERLRIKSNGIIVAGNSGTNFGNASIQSFIAHGNTAGESAFSAVDTTSVATGVGGEIAFHGKYNTGAQDYAYLGHIRGTKENATAGNTACALKFFTRPNATAPVERLRIASDGKIGVNATTTALIAPSYTLDLGGNDGTLDSSEQNTIRIRCNNGGTAFRVASGGGGSRITLLRADGESSGNLCFGETDKSAYGVSLVYHGDRSGNENSFAVYMDQNTNANQIEAFNIRQNGDYMHGGSSYSDRDQKENITAISGTALDKITQLSPKTWNWKPEYHDIPTDRIFAGFIAQEVQPHIPSIVTGTDGQGDMALDYQGLLAWTIKALTELKSENDNLKARVNTLEGS